MLWLLTSLWTALMCYLLLWPSKGTSVEDVSSFFGGTAFTDAVGHVAMMCVETALLYGLFHHYAPDHASRYALGCAMLLGLILEVSQRWIPDRGSTWYDLAANWLGAAMVLVAVSKVSKFEPK